MKYEPRIIRLEPINSNFNVSKLFLSENHKEDASRKKGSTLLDVS
jgi:hypothetical protein